MSHAKAMCIAHRGFSGKFAENTILAFRKAINAGTDGLELDIQKTADDKIIIHHDDEFGRTTNGDGFIINRPYKGYIDSLRTKKDDQPVPLFTDLLDLLTEKGNENLFVIIDVKPQAGYMNPKILTHLGRVFKDYKISTESSFAKRIHIGIWDPEYLPYARNELPGFGVAYIGASVETARSTYFNKVESFNIYWPIIKQNPSFVTDCHTNNMKVFVWTVNKEEDMKAAYEAKVDAVLTDYIDVCLKARP